MKKGLLITVGVVLLITAVLGMSLVGARNSLISADENISNSWAQVENVLQRRSDLIPNLVQTVKGYAKHEEEIFDHVADARAKLAGATTMAGKIEADQQLTGALSRLLVVAERYPDLKANQNFQSLQDELSGTENRIAVERMRFNETVKDYNVQVRRFPSNIAASLFGFDKKEIYFKAEEGAKAAPKVQF